MAEPPFQHEQLRLSEGSIRLVQVHGSSSKSGPLSLRITQFATSKRPPYAAISYTWGTAGKSFPVTINGKPFGIRPNLWYLLSHLRKRGESRFLWVDALCINQNDRDERNFHVQFMSRIYEEAELAIVWLGVPSDDRREARAIDFVIEMANHRPNKSAGASFRDLYLTEKARARWINLLSFCRCTYWSRTWIIQEFLQARRIEVHCGTATLDWTAFDTVLNSVKSLSIGNVAGSIPLPLQTTISAFLSTIPSRLTSRRLSHTASLLQELLQEFYDAQCTLPRDKVYGMLGIAADCGPYQDPLTSETTQYRGPVPDYAKHIVEVYFDVLNYIRDTSPTHSVAPLTALLLQKSLNITESAIKEYTTPIPSDAFPKVIAQTTLHLKPDYISTISAVLPVYTSISDLKQKLSQFDWSPYVGFEIVRPRTPTPNSPGPNTKNKPSRPGAAPFMQRSSSSSLPLQQTSSRSNSISTSISTLSPPPMGATHRRNSSSSTVSRQITQLAPLPSDLIPNILALAESDAASAHLRKSPTHILSSPALSKEPQPNHPTQSNSPPIPSPQEFHLPLHSPFPTTDDPPAKPFLILESTPLTPPLRLGLSIPGVRRGDVLLQFNGLNLTLIGRRIGSSGSLQLVGRAVMATHSGLSGALGVREGEVHPACSKGEALVCPCLMPILGSEPSEPQPVLRNEDVSVVGPLERVTLESSAEEQERVNFQQQHLEHVKRHEDVEVETDALSLWGILRDV